MQATAIAKRLRITAQKARLVVDMVRGKPVAQALDILNFANQKGAELVKKVLESAIANAENNEGADVDELRVHRIFVDEGVTMVDPSPNPFAPRFMTAVLLRKRVVDILVPQQCSRRATCCRRE